MKSLMLLLKTLLSELGEMCSVSTSRDWETVSRRVEHEGLSFLTITLPAVAEFLEKGLQDGCVDHTNLLGFKFVGSLPAFLQGFFGLCFDSECGKLIDTPLRNDAIFAIRQFCLYCKKIEIPCSEERVTSAFRKYIDCEQELKDAQERFDDNLYKDYHRIAHVLFRDIFTIMDSCIYNGTLIPNHGPGATADKLYGNEKYTQSEWNSRLERYFPFLENIYPNYRYSSHSYRNRVSLLEPGAELPVRVISVPKTLKTPRVIAIEPTCMMYTQQAIKQKLQPLLEDPNTFIGRNSFLGFESQEINRDLAKQGSIDGSVATLDLSEASDRVSNQHVLELIGPEFRHFRDAVQDTRSRKADVPGYGVIRLAKFASMGSALCFPIESMVFLTIVFTSILKELNLPFTRESIERFSGRVRIYGDDIIVPTDMAQCVISGLETFGLKVNTRKSFRTGMFRESCGAEYFNGFDVSVDKLRKLIPQSRTDVPEVISLVALRNRHYVRGLWRTAAHLDGVLEKILGGHYPVVNNRGVLEFSSIQGTSSLLGRYSFLNYISEGLSYDTQNPYVRGYVPRYTPRQSRLLGVYALEKCLISGHGSPPDPKHLEYSGRPVAVTLKLRKGRPF